MKNFSKIKIQTPSSGNGFIVTTITGEEAPLETIHAEWKEAEARIQKYLELLQRRSRNIPN